MRQIIISAIGLLLIGAALFASKKMGEQEKPKAPANVQKIPSVYTELVKNGNTPITVTASGNLTARERIELFSEVQGIFEYSDKLFEPGVYFPNGSTLLRINSEEHRANLRAQKSSFYNLVVAALPDLRFDFQEAVQKWEKYVADFEVEKPLPALPSFDSEKEKMFIAGRNINTQWHTVKNLEERLQKYTIYAPYNGILTEATVDKGALVRAGQKLGSFINPSVYELEVAVNAAYADLMRTGATVMLHDVDGSKTYKGSVVRLNRLIDPATQTLQAFIQVAGKDLREGMYLEAELTAKQEPNTFEVSRKLLVDNNKLFYLQDSTLALVEVEPVFFKDKTVVVRGLTDGMKVLSKPLPAARAGMKVKEF